jgi:hypothetical protein
MMTLRMNRKTLRRKRTRKAIMRWLASNGGGITIIQL